MNKLHATLSVFVALFVGAFVASCWSFSAPALSGSDAATSGTGGSDSTSSGGDTGSGTGGSGTGGNATGTGGSAIGTGGATSSGGATGTGGAAGNKGTGGSPGTGGTPGTGGGAAGAKGTGGAATGGTPGTGGTATGGTPGTGGTATGGTPGTGGTVAVTGPCDILAAAGNACAAAHSTVRVLYGKYTGPLYQVCKGSSSTGPNACTSGSTKDIVSVAGGLADSATQDSFCSGATCTISIIYDQSGNKNDLKPGPGGGAVATADKPVGATDLKTTLNGHEVYGVLIKVGTGYRAGCTGCGVTKPVGTATGDAAETEYMVTSQNNLIDGCCFDYGNAETDSHDDGNGTMEAVYFGGGVVWGTGSPGGHTNGPWVEADLENGLFAGWDGDDQDIATNTPLKFNFVTAVVVGDVQTQNSNKGRFALYGADATNGSLTTEYDGIRPAKTGYVPMHKQGSIILGIGGDNSNSDGGEWFEGVMASGAASLATLNAVQANIVAAKYGK